MSVKMDHCSRHLCQDRQEILDKWVEGRSEVLCELLHQGTRLLRDRSTQADDLTLSFAPLRFDSLCERGRQRIRP